MTGSQAVAVSQGLIDASLAGNYSALTESITSIITPAIPISMWLTGVIDYARSKSVPVWNADRWLSFTQTRHDANFTNMSLECRAAGVLSFNIAMAATAGLTPTTMLPLSYGGRPLQSVTVDGGAYTLQCSDD